MHYRITNDGLPDRRYKDGKQAYEAMVAKKQAKLKRSMATAQSGIRTRFINSDRIKNKRLKQMFSRLFKLYLIVFILGVIANITA